MIDPSMSFGGGNPLPESLQIDNLVKATSRKSMSGGGGGYSTGETRSSYLDLGGPTNEVKHMSDVNQQLVDQKIATANAELRKDMSDLRGDVNTKFATIGGKIESMEGKLDNLRTLGMWTIATVLASAIGVIAIVIAVQIGLVGAQQTAFDQGAAIDQRIQGRISEATKSQNERIDQLLNAIEAQQKQQSR